MNKSKLEISIVKMYGYNIGYCIAILVLLTCIAHGEPIVKEEFPTRTKSFDVKLKIDEDAKTHEYNENEAHEIVRRHTTKGEFLTLIWCQF